MQFEIQKRPENQLLGSGLSMVGVARIELATPAMSTQWLRRKCADLLGLRWRGSPAKREQNAKRIEFHRNYTGPKNRRQSLPSNEGA